MRSFGFAVAAVVVTSMFAGRAEAGGRDLARVSVTIGGLRIPVGTINEGDRTTVKEGPVTITGHADASGLHLDIKTPGPDVYVCLHKGTLRIRVHAIFDIFDETYPAPYRNVSKCVQIPVIGEFCVAFDLLD